MTIENKFPVYRLDLQYFAEGEEDNNPPTSGEEDLASAIRSLIESEGEEDIDDVEPPEDDNDIDDLDDEPEDDIEDENDELDDENLEDDQEDEPEVPVKKQSKEQNAEFARKRREAEAKARAEAELERLKQEAPEFQLAQMLSEQYGQPVEAIMAQIKEAQLQKDAQEAKVPVEVLRKQRESEERASRLEQEINMLKFQNWQTQIKADGARVMSEYKMLTQEDINTATDYILNVARNVEMPLEDAVFAIHGKKIVESLAKGEVQNNLAKQSGRARKTPLAPNNGKAPKIVALTAQERQMARAFSMTDEEYAKYKS